MRRIPLLLFALLLAAPAFADDFRAAKKTFETAFKSPLASAKERLAAVKALQGFDTKDAAKVLILGIPVCRRQYDVLIVERANVQSGKIEFPDGGPAPRLAELKGEIDREMQVLEAIEDSLARLRDVRAVTFLARDVLGRGKDTGTRLAVANALGRIGHASAIPHLLKALGDRNQRLAAAAVLALGRLKATTAVPKLLDLLEEKTWTVRAAVYEALGRIGDLGTIAPLIDRLAAEQGRLAEDCAAALEVLTGQRFGTAVDAWRRWYDANRALIDAGGPLPKPPPPPEAKEKGDDGYYGLPVRTRRAIFILDISMSMSYSAEKDQELPKPGEDSRLDVAKRELRRALNGFDPKGRFAVVVFNDRVSVWKKTMQDATKANRSAAASWATALKSTGTTNIYAALERAFSIAGMGVSDKHYDVSADSIYLLSDGAPTNEDFTDDDPERILRACREWNRLGRVQIHTIGLRGHNAWFMGKLAKENGGTYVVR